MRICYFRPNEKFDGFDFDCLDENYQKRQNFLTLTFCAIQYVSE